MSPSGGSGHLTAPTRRADLDGLRGVAVLSIVGYHVMPYRMAGGFVGVDVFFVLSGFLITTLIQENLASATFTFRDFYQRRVLRIFPALLLALIACLAFGWFELFADEYAQLGKHAAAGAGFVANLVLWAQSGYFDYSAETQPLHHLWSLGIEEQFYLLWPPLLWCAWKRRWNLMAITTITAAASFAVNVVTVHHDVAAAFYAPYSRVWELLAGAVLAYGVVRPGDRSRQMLSIAGAALIVASLVVINRDRVFPGWWALAPAVGAALVIVAGPGAWLNRTILSSRVLVWFGLISFPLYLWQWPLLAYERLVAGDMPDRSMRIVLALVAIGMAWATYRWIERPIRFGQRRRGATAIALVAGMVVAGGVGYAIHLRAGLPSRDSAAVVLNEHDMNEEQSRYWNGPRRQNFDTVSPKVIVYGDSQAFDIFAALKNDANIGLALAGSPSNCTGFFLTDARSESLRDKCQKAFDDLLASADMQKADTLLYAHMVLPDPATIDGHREGVRQLLAARPRLKIVLLANKPLIGYRYVPLNDIVRQHPSRVGMNDFLIRMIYNPDPHATFLKTVAANAGVDWLDVQEQFCRNGCPLYVNDQFTYFDQAHWTTAGARVFYDKFSAAPEYSKTIGVSR